jgi:hypothetical protein
MSRLAVSSMLQILASVIPFLRLLRWSLALMRPSKCVAKGRALPVHSQLPVSFLPNQLMACEPDSPCQRETPSIPTERQIPAGRRLR